MAERRKIIIETGAEPSEPLPTPHFDAEATLTARPVIPLTDQETYRPNYGDYGARPAKPFWKRPALLIPIILAAVGIGIAAGFAIGLYRNRSVTQPPVATAPAATTENTDLSQKVEPPPAQEEAEVVPEPETRAPVTEEKEEKEEPEEKNSAPKVEERERSARDERRDDDNEARQPVVAKPPAATREKKPIKVDEYEIEDVRAERQAERERRREERRERRRRQREEGVVVPRVIERGVRETDRIREIFEGRQP